MRELPSKRTLPVYVLYDEFGHSTIPNFVETANTIRAYKISLSIVLQSISQLSSKYGKDDANSVLGGFASYLCYAGSDPETASFFGRIIGRTRITQRPDVFDHNTEQYREQNLINANEVRTMKDSEVLIVTKNRLPVQVNSKGFYQLGKFKLLVRKGSADLPSVTPPTPQYIVLDS